MNISTGRQIGRIDTQLGQLSAQAFHTSGFDLQFRFRQIEAPLRRCLLAGQFRFSDVVLSEKTQFTLTFQKITLQFHQVGMRQLG